ncbi:hypothetical protein FACS189434_06760 [Bacteroidia bacterium]|nr:hypothetical protein FACS189434_06760 [Bacteroidia bacterium]
MKKSTFKHKFVALFACLSILSFSNLLAQTTITQADIITALGGNGEINVTGDAIISDNIVAQNAVTAKTLTITATGNITISGNLDLSGVAGNPNNYTNYSDGSSGNRNNDAKNGHSLTLSAGENITITGNINTSGGAGAKSNAGGWFPANIRKGGVGGNSGNVTITAKKVDISSIISANGGNAGGTNTDSGAMEGASGGNGGNITINSNTTLTISAISVNGGNGESNYQQQPAGAAGTAGKVILNAETNISTTGAITANAGHTGQQPTSGYSNDGVAGVPLSKNGGNVEITSNGTVSIGGNITANGGNGTGQATNDLVPPNNTRNKASTDGGQGGKIEIISCGKTSINAAITANGGLSGQPIGGPNGGGTSFNQAGAGGAGGDVTITSNNDDIIINALIQANGIVGQSNILSLQGTNAGSSTPYNGKGDAAGWGGNGGKVTITAHDTLLVNTVVEAIAGNGGNSAGSNYGEGSGGNSGTIECKAAFGDETSITNQLSATNGKKGNYTGSNHYQFVEIKDGEVKIPTVTITPYTPPTLIGQIDVNCDDDGIVVSKTITRDTLDNYLANYTTKLDERWEICLDGSTWNAITFPFTVTDDNKDDYNGYLRCVYTECGEQVRLENVLIYIPCVPVPPTPEDCPELPNAIIWGGGQDVNHNFLQGDEKIEKLTIFNRYGTTVFEGASGKGWNGTYKNKPVEPGNYYYVLKHSCLGEVKGTIRVVKE